MRSSRDVRVMTAAAPDNNDGNKNNNEDVFLDMEGLRGRHVLVVEDIVDTGNTLAKFMPMVREHGPKSCEICTLLTKRLTNDGSKNGGIVPKYVGFSVPDEFVVGYGLDYNEMYRDLEDIWIMSKAGIEFGGMDGLKKGRTNPCFILSR